MKKILLFFSVLIQSLPGNSQDKYVIFFTDKNNSPYSLSNPSAFLTNRSITRRTNQGIGYDMSDLPVNSTYVNGVVNAGATVLNVSKWFNSATVVVNNAAVLNAILALPYVNGSTQVARYSSHRNAAADKFRRESVLRNTDGIPYNAKMQSLNYGVSFNQVHMLGADIMHNNGFHGEGKVIAVLDAGFFQADIMFAFDSLRANNQILGTWDFVAGDSNVYDDYNHGSYVLSLIGGNLPGQLIGTAPKADFWLLHTEDVFSENIIEEYNWAAGAEFADSVGADIISSSLGYATFDLSQNSHTYADLNGHTAPASIAANLAARKGIIVVNSAGNEGNSPWHFIMAPADADSIMAVGAVDSAGAYASFSSKGPSADGRVKPDVAAQGFQTIVADVNNFGVFPGNGTSFACPLISGISACLWQCKPLAKNIDVINAIKQSASQFSNPDSFVGYGIPNIPYACSILNSVYNPIAHMTEDAIINITPNPFENSCSIDFFSDTNQQITLEIFDVLGKKVVSNNYFTDAKTINHLSINTALSKGAYFLRVLTEQKVLSRKLVRK